MLRDERAVYPEAPPSWQLTGNNTAHTVPHVTLLVSSGKFTSGLDFFLSAPEKNLPFAL